MRLRFLDRFRNGTHVRRTSLADLKVLSEMALENYRAQGVTLAEGLEERLAPYIREMMAGDQTITFLAEHGGKVAGMVQVGPAPCDVSDGQAVLGVQWLYVRPEYRKRPHVIMALFRVVAALARETGCARIRCGLTEDQTDLADLYMKHLGFRVEARATVFVADTPEA